LLRNDKQIGNGFVLQIQVEQLKALEPFEEKIILETDVRSMVKPNDQNTKEDPKIVDENDKEDTKSTEEDTKTIEESDQKIGEKDVISNF
jgi:hypothetical protein